ncbi:hypothetical protein MMC18_003641 [Xylographa bjoerkii]|nr:hypothetical protein [Xylographa bjoerkii]
MNKAAINPLDVTFVEMHGTGTQFGDAIESESVLDVFAPVTPRRCADQHLHLGAVKANIGHGEAAAGISSLIKVLLAFQNNSLTPHVGIKTLINPLIPKDLDHRHVGLDFDNVPWLRRQQGTTPRFAIVNAFGAHGGNTTILLEDGPEVVRERVASGLAEDRSVHTIAISARSKKSLESNLEKLLSHITEHPDTNISDLSYTTCARRMHHNFRIATSVTSIPALKKFLESHLNGKTAAETKSIPVEAPSVVMTFTGQGASYTGIDGVLFKDFPAVRKEVLQLDRIVQRLGFPTVVPTLDGSNYEEVTSPVVAQLSIVVLEIALARSWMSFGVTPSAVIGHSLGEYSACAVSGVLSVADALYLVGSRAGLTEKLCTPGSHGMLSVRDALEALPLQDLTQVRDVMDARKKLLALNERERALRTLLPAHPEHYAKPACEGQEGVIDVIGEHMISLRMVVTDDVPEFVRAYADPVYPFKKPTVVKLQDGTTAYYSLHEFRDVEEGCKLRLRVVFPAAAPEIMFSEHAEHMAIEFRFGVKTIHAGFF